MIADSAVPLAAAFLGALVGGLISWAVASRSARHARRARYGEAMLDTLGHAHQKLALVGASIEGGEATATDLDQRFALPEEATRLWAQVELAASLEFRRSDREAMRRWAMRYHEVLREGATDRTGLERLDLRLDVAQYTVIAWIAELARGRDFDLSDAEVVERFGPDLGEHPWNEEGPRP